MQGEKEATARKFMLIDGFGAILSVITLGVVLVKLEWFFGIPKSALYFLASIPVFYAIYDFYCYFNVEGNLAKFLKGIAIANLLYTCVSIGFAIYHRDVLTQYGWIYIALETIVLITIAAVELKVANQALQETS